MVGCFAKWHEVVTLAPADASAIYQALSSRRLICSGPSEQLHFGRGSCFWNSVAICGIEKSRAMPYHQQGNARTLWKQKNITGGRLQHDANESQASIDFELN